MLKLKAVFFDIDNTLFPTRDFTELARKGAIKAMVKEGLPFSEKRAYSELLRVVKKYGPNYPKHFDRLLERLGTGYDPKLIAAGVIAYHEAKGRLAPYPDVPPTLRALRRKGLRLYALSRGVDIKQWDKLIRLNLHPLFNGVFVTDAKTTAFYRSVLRRLKLQPDEAVMVGDCPRIDVIPAKKAGITAIHLLKGKHAHDPDGRKADFRIKSMRELLVVLR